MRVFFRFLAGIIVALGVFAIMWPLAFSQEAAKETVSAEVLSGEIVSVDLEKSTVVVKYLVDTETETYGEITCSIDSTTEIEKGSNTVQPSDLQAGDSVFISYYTDAEGKKIADFILVKSEM